MLSTAGIQSWSLEQLGTLRFPVCDVFLLRVVNVLIVTTQQVVVAHLEVAQSWRYRKHHL
jgi:hypothetical protein